MNWVMASQKFFNFLCGYSNYSWISSLDEKEIGRKYKLKVEKRFSGISIGVVNNPDLMNMVDTNLELIGISDENDRSFGKIFSNHD